MEQANADEVGSLKRLPLDAPDEMLLDAVREWVSLVVAGHFAAAAEFFYEPNPGRAGAWTAELIERVISNYGSVEPFPDGRTFQVTPLATASGGPTPRHEVDRTDALTGFISFDLPLNGEWSDLTAMFEFHQLHGGVVLVLDDLHVM